MYSLTLPLFTVYAYHSCQLIISVHSFIQDRFMSVHSWLRLTQLSAEQWIANHSSAGMWVCLTGVWASLGVFNKSTYNPQSLSSLSLEKTLYDQVTTSVLYIRLLDLNSSQISSTCIRNTHQTTCTCKKPNSTGLRTTPEFDMTQTRWDEMRWHLWTEKTICEFNLRSHKTSVKHLRRLVNTECLRTF